MQQGAHLSTGVLIVSLTPRLDMEDREDVRKPKGERSSGDLRERNLERTPA
jgi:hypothetical protein